MNGHHGRGRSIGGLRDSLESWISACDMFGSSEEKIAQTSKRLHPPIG